MMDGRYVQNVQLPVDMMDGRYVQNVQLPVHAYKLFVECLDDGLARAMSALDTTGLDSGSSTSTPRCHSVTFDSTSISTSH